MINKSFAIDSAIVTLLILSTGGLIFVFNRNVMHVIYFLIIAFVLITSKVIQERIFSMHLFFSLNDAYNLHSKFCFALNDQAIEKFMRIFDYYHLHISSYHLNNRSVDRFITGYTFV